MFSGGYETHAAAMAVEQVLTAICPILLPSKLLLNIDKILIP